MESINLIIYILLTVIFFCSFIAEFRDINKRFIKKFCEDPQPENISRVAVYWRRSYILSFIIVNIFNLVTGFKLDAKKVLIFIIISMLIIYFHFNFYSYHFYDNIYKVIKNKELCE
jgi:hypothetical protein